MRWLHVVGLSAVTLGIGAFFLAGPRPSPERMHDWEPQPLIGTEPDPQPPIALAPTTDPPTSPLRDMTGVRARMVWVQDAGNGTDVFAGGADLRLMGLDTDDGLGERPILPDRANYVRPLLTSSGQQVVFSNRHTDRVWIVGWDGTGLRPLGRGMALAVWRDPLDGRDWVYVGTDRQEDAFGTLRRRRIDEPEVDETVWNQTLVGEEL
ncbi:MAG: hypothetical protein HY701_08400, partial [Gemmatimonadetes bacterium]|nr:hypothetical protein [Gemmatimonadota bacterium]